jgi:putative cardiolipin synthase
MGNHHSNYSLRTALALSMVSGCDTLPRDFDRPVSHAYEDTGQTFLGRMRADEKRFHPGQSGFLLLAGGLDAFVARAVLAGVSERCIDAQYYLLHNDLVGALFIDQLLKAADRGVRVRLLVDDMDLEGRDLGAAVLDSHPNMEVRIFNPFSRKASRLSQFLTRFGSVTRRMHNKSFTVDNQATILGGRNIGNEYFEADPALAFADLDVMAMGPVVREVSSSFDQYWNSELAYPASILKGRTPTAGEMAQTRGHLDEFISRQTDSPYLRALENSDLAHDIRRNQFRFEWGVAEVVCDQPEKILHPVSKSEYHLSSGLRPHVEGIQKTIIILSPYFIPGKEGVSFLRQLQKKGVRVRILTNSLASTDVSIVHAGYARYRKDLLRAGIELYEMNRKTSKEKSKEKISLHGSSKASLHAKSFVFDGKKAFIGSLNLDPRSFEQNTEIGVLFNSLKVAGDMEDWFDRSINKLAFRLELRRNGTCSEHIRWHGFENGRKRVFLVEPYSGFWRRFGVALMGILPVESQL